MARPRILLINPNTSRSVTDLLAEEARRAAGGRAEIVAATARFGAAGIECLAEAAVAAHAVLEGVAEHPNVDAVIVAAFMDPGLEALREVAPMPAVGLAEAGVCAAASGGRRFSIVSLGPALRPGVERIVAGCGASGGLASIRYVSAGVLQLARDRAGLLDEIVAVANRAAAEDRAEAILFGGAVFAGVSREIAGRVPVPLVEGVAAAVEAALAAIAGKSPAAPRREGPLPKPYPGISPALARMIAGRPA